MDAYFRELGQTVYARWLRENFSLTAFPGIAREALVRRPPARHVDRDRLVRDFLLRDDQPFQSSSGFGQPELIVFDHPRFYIQVLFWLDGTTDIHQHGFSGAFHVLEGSSIHSRFAFRGGRSVTPRFRTGTLELLSTELLEAGATGPILSGDGCIHSLFHLDSPSVSVVVRTHADPGTDPQFTYLPPHVALDPVQDDALTLRRKQLLDLLESTRDPRYTALVLKMIAGLDLERGFFVLQNCIGHLRSLGTWNRVWAAFAKKHGKKAGALLATLEEIIRRDALVAMRGSVEDADHRFFLALLLNVKERALLLRMVAKRYRGKPLETLLGWASELAETSPSGTWILDARFPPDLEVDEEEQAGLFLEALGYFLRGGRLPSTLKHLRKDHLAALRDSFASSSWKLLLHGS